MMLEAAIAVALFAAVGGFIFWRNRPTPTDIAVWELGFNDGAEGREPEYFEHPRNHETYMDGYHDGSSGRTRRADAQKIRNRKEGTK